MHFQGSMHFQVLIQLIGKQVRHLMTFTDIPLEYFEAQDVMLPSFHSWELLGSGGSTNKPQKGESLHTFIKEWKMCAYIREGRLKLARILKALGVEAVKEAIKVLAEFGSCHVVSLWLGFEPLYLCQCLDSYRN